MRRTILVCALLSTMTLAVYWPVVHNDFVNYDDNAYIVQNRQVQVGLTWKGLAWAFGRLHGDHTYWHPLTWVSHMVDCQLFGLKPAGHHLVNLLFHAVNSVVVFLLFKRLTRAFWRSALLAALFAVHPLQVDTVAWVAERKNLLSALFFFLTLWSYLRYVEAQGLESDVKSQAEVRKNQSSVSNDHSNASRIPHPAPRIRNQEPLFYLLSLALFACGLMCKPVLVTLPFVLLLLDYWPLQRLSFPLLRCSRSSLLRLLREKLPFLLLSATSCFITIISNRAVGALVEASSLLPLEVRVQNALVSYVRYIGKTLWPLNLAVFYPYPDHFPAWETVVCGMLLLAISGLAIGTARRRPYLLVGWFWFLGVLVPFIGLLQAGEQAMADRFAYVPLIGLFLLLVWGTEELTHCWRNRRFLMTAAGLAALVCCAGLSHRQTGYWQNSVTLFSHALAVTDNNARARSNLGIALAEEGRTEEAMQQLLEALRLNPEHAVAHGAVGLVREQQGRFGEAIDEYGIALRLKPDFPEALNNLAWLKATNPDPKCRDGATAVGLAEQACRLTEQQEPLFIGTLAAAYAEAGRFKDAVKTAERAKNLAKAAGQTELVKKNQQLLELYRVGKPYHEAERSRAHPGTATEGTRLLPPERRLQPAALGPSMPLPAEAGVPVAVSRRAERSRN